MNNFIISMIRVKGNKISEGYANYCLPSWTNAGFDVQLYDAVTPDTIKDQDPVSFKNTKRPPTETEKACWLSQYNLWKQCFEEDTPMLILEHDAYLVQPEVINFNPHLQVQFFGQHSMEAVMFHPQFAGRLLQHIYKNGMTGGPMTMVDDLLGFFNNIITKQSSQCLPHARYQGPMAPVRSVIDPNVGNTVKHMTDTRGDKVKQAILGNNDLFKIIDIS